MTPPPPIGPDFDDEPLDPELAAIAAAIVDGDAVDWTACGSGGSAEFAAELRIVADVAQLHRSLPAKGVIPSSSFPDLPRTVGALTLTQALGRGSFGEVFRAWDNRLHRDVAVKLLFDNPSRTDRSASLNEGRLLAKVRHANVVTVYGAEEIDGRVALVTEFVDGCSLAEVALRRGPLPADEVARIGIDVCRALAAVHAAGLLHRDIKAQNVMQDSSGRIVLMDFGAGTLRPDDADDAMPELAGTPLYVAPEIWTGAAPTVQSDIYSTGVLLYYLLTGGFPMAGGTTADIRRGHANRRAKPVAEAKPDLPAAVAKVIDRALSPTPEARYRTAAEFEQALQVLGQARQRDRHRRKLMASAVFVVATTLAVVIAIAVISRQRQAEPPRAVLAGTDRNLPAPAAVPAPDNASRAAIPTATPESALPDAQTTSVLAHQVVVPDYFAIGVPSRDGRYLPYVDATRRDGWLLEVATGRTQRVIEHDGTGYVESLSLAADASRLAFVLRRRDGTSELHVATVNDTWPQTAVNIQRPPDAIPLRSEAAESIFPGEWTTDSTRLLCAIARQNGSLDLAIVSLGSDTATALHTFTGPRPRRASLSPDGKFVAYDLPPVPSDPARDIYVVATRGAWRPRVLVSGPGDDALPVWSADGREVLFSSNRDGSTDGWVVPIVDGAAVAAPVKFARGFDGVSPAGVTSRGSLYYANQIRASDVRSIRLNADGTSASAGVSLPPPSTLSRSGAAWSPDGRTLAYIVLRGQTDMDRAGTFVRLIDRRTGRSRDLVPALSYFGGTTLRWSPDGNEILIRGRRFDQIWGYYALNARTGATRPLVVSNQPGLQQQGPSAQWITRRTLLYVHMQRGLMEHDIDNGTEAVLVPPGTDRITSFGISPDGATMALSLTSGTGAAAASWLELRPVGGGDIRELVRMPGLSSIVFQAWSPDGQRLFYAASGAAQTSSVMQVDVTGGTPREIGLMLDGPAMLHWLSFHPNGREVTYTSGQPAFQLWKLDGIKP